MTLPVGGLRDRLIKQALYDTVKNGLTDLGWFASGRQHAPINFIARAVDYNQEVQPNTLGIAEGAVESFDIEMGTDLAEHEHPYFFDFFGESDAVSVHLIGDVRDILAGRMPSIGRRAPILEVYDVRMATPPLLFTCQLVDIAIEPPPVQWSRPYLANWRVCAVTVVDTYGNEEDDA